MSSAIHESCSVSLTRPIGSVQSVFVVMWWKSPKKGLTFTSNTSSSATWDTRSIATASPARCVSCSRLLLKKYVYEKKCVNESSTIWRVRRRTEQMIQGKQVRQLGATGLV